MNILYLSNSCSEEEYNLINANAKTIVNVQAVKFNRLFAEGLAINGNNVTMISGRPINYIIHPRKLYKKKTEKNNNVNYIYPAFFNYKIIRQLMLVKNVEAEINRWCKNNNNGIIVCDVLNFTLFMIASKIAKKKHIKLFGIVTDLPEILSGGVTKKVIKQNELISDCDGLILLSQEMNKKINPKSKPYIVIEGFCDINMANKMNLYANKYDKKVVLYAGLLHKKYGVKALTNAFIKANIKDSELHLYGYGDFEEELQEITKTNSKVKYFGTKPNTYVVEEELKATLLVNPRPTDEEYVKYSFPSKNMEYIVSGTPLLTTNLPSMPKEYNDYCYVVNGFKEEELLVALIDLLSRDTKELYSYGKKAKEWILNEKNNIAQTKKVIEFIKGL